MPPKKNKLSEEGLSTKTIKVKKLDSVKNIDQGKIDQGEIETRPKDSIIKSTIKIMEPIVEIVENEPGSDKSNIKVKKNILKPKTLDKTTLKNKEIKKEITVGDSTVHENITEYEEHEQDKQDEQVLKNSGQKNDAENDKDEKDDKSLSKTVKEQKKDKIHNHSKPKTIIASTQDVNTVDMFGEDDLDFRYVMMNYDYTKNVTMPKITKYERALLIGKRAKQIEEGANPNVKYISGQSVVSIAEEELRQRKIPLIIKRPIGNKFEYWKPADMEVNMD